MDVGDIRYPFAVWFVCTELPVEQILVLVDLLPHLLPLSAPPNPRKQTVFLHDAQDGLGIAVDT